MCSLRRMAGSRRRASPRCYTIDQLRAYARVLARLHRRAGSSSSAAAPAQAATCTASIGDTWPPTPFWRSPVSATNSSGESGKPSPAGRIRRDTRRSSGRQHVGRCGSIATSTSSWCGPQTQATSGGDERRTLCSLASRWTGNDVRPLEYGERELKGAALEPVLRDIAEEAVTVVGDRMWLRRELGIG